MSLLTGERPDAAVTALEPQGLNEAFIDCETRSTLDLKIVGAHRYAADPTTEVLCVGYALDDGPVKLWRPGDPVPREIKKAKTLIAHNATFERLIWHHKLKPKYGWPEPKLEQWIDTMARAAAAALPHGLDKIAKALNLSQQKDVVGGRLMLRVSKPRKPRKSEPPGIYWYDDAEKYLEPLYAYCRQDVEITRELYQYLPPLSPTEQEIWLLDQRINNHGFYVDQQLAHAADKIAKAMHPQLNAELTRITEGAVGTINQVAALKDWISTFNIEIKNLDKKSVEKCLNEIEDLPKCVHRALELRQLGAQAASKKVNALLERCSTDARLRGAYFYHAAATGRWASKGAQIQNLKRPQTEDIDEAIKVISHGSYTQAKKAFGNPLSVVGDVIRSMLCAPPGHMLIGADFSGIEARVTAWLAGEETKLQIFRDFDAGIGPDPYITAASKIFRKSAEEITAEERQVGKACELAFGFAGGAGAFLRMAPDTKFSLKQINDFKEAWREAHPNIVSYWDKLWRAVWTAIRNHETTVYCTGTPPAPSIYLHVDESPTLWMTLPSGRHLAYPHIRFEDEHFTGRIVNPNVVRRGYTGRRIIVFKDNAAGQWRDVPKVWKGTFIENLVQATARDLLAHAMLRVDAAGLKIVGHVHDECICEVPEKQTDKLMEELAALMVVPPDWAEGWPIVAKPWKAKRYVK